MRGRPSFLFLALRGFRVCRFLCSRILLRGRLGTFSPALIGPVAWPRHLARPLTRHTALQASRPRGRPALSRDNLRGLLTINRDGVRLASHHPGDDNILADLCSLEAVEFRARSIGDRDRASVGRTRHYTSQQVQGLPPRLDVLPPPKLALSTDPRRFR